jgi:hypothetical protein
VILCKAQWGVPPPEDAPKEVLSHWDEVQKKRAFIIGGPCPFDNSDQVDRLTANVLVALTERPEGLTVTEHRPSAKAARKRGRRHFPGTEYVIGSTTPLWKHNHDISDTEDSATSTEGEDAGLNASESPQEGWTLSVRTIVRGHWRKQHYGPRMSEKKVIWIKPHWKGPKDAPISAHATSISPRHKQ